MAGESLLPISETPDYIASTVSFVIAEYGQGRNWVDLFYCERDTVIDSACVWWLDSDNTDDVSIALMHKDDTKITDVISHDTDINAVETVYQFVVDEDTNVVPAGYFIVAETLGATGDVDFVTVQMRIRTRVR